MKNIKAYGKLVGWILLNNIIGNKGQQFIGTGGSDSARYCYSVWMRHLILMNEVCNSNAIPEVVAELGPGDSLGTGFAALLSGVKKYYALDTVHYSNTKKNIDIFDEMIELFNNKESIPNEEEFPKIRPKLNSYSFPSHLMSDAKLKVALSEDRITQIRKDISSVNDGNMNGSVCYQAPWSDSSIIKENSVDFLFSQAVLEHVDDLPSTYLSMKKWLKEDGIMAHTIDFKSHGTSVYWNGHWKYSETVWNLIRGRASYLINRKPLSYHLECSNNATFKILFLNKNLQDDGIKLNQLASNFADLTEEDLHTSGVYLVCINSETPLVKDATS